MKGIKIIAATVAIAATTAACQGPSNTQIGAGAGALAGGLLGSQFGSGTGQIAATLGGALLGGLFGGAVGSYMDEQDQQQASQATYSALAQPTGQPVSWSNPQTGNYGQVTATPAPQYGANCQKAESIMYVDGRQEVVEMYVYYNPQTQRYEEC